jgi:hypothetical protein
LFSLWWDCSFSTKLPAERKIQKVKNHWFKLLDSWKRRRRRRRKKMEEEK